MSPTAPSMYQQGPMIVPPITSPPQRILTLPPDRHGFDEYDEVDMQHGYERGTYRY
uniref:Velvet domain-containing protein n=1 Tax=Heterorhabditis bacteriophora TaxID=37862 RepID=A0A1I7XQ69_HETBA